MRADFLAWCAAAAALTTLPLAAADVEAEAARTGGKGRSHWHVGPFFEYRRADPGPATYWAVRPFYSQVRDPATRTVTRDVLWPLGAYHYHNDASWYRALIAYGDARDVDPSWSFNIFPLWFCGKDRTGEDYWGAFPFYGEHPHFLFMDDWRFFLWPVWQTYSVKGVRSHGVLWPFVTWRDAPREGLGVWPFWGTARQRESDHGYCLWPLATWASYDEDRDTSGAGWSWMAWPLYGQIRRAREAQDLLLPPFFSYARTDSATRWRVPWPLVEVLRSSTRDRISIWPFWESVRSYPYASGKERKPEERTWRVGWQLVESTTLTTDRTREDRFNLFPFWTHETRSAQRRDGTHEEVASYTRLWPFWSCETKKGLSHHRVLELVPIRHVEGIDRNWSPFWTFWESRDRLDGRTRHSLFWNFVTWHTGAKKAKEKFAASEISDKYYRLAIRGIGGGEIVQLGEFSLYAADGSRVNGGGMKLVEPCAVNALAPGECFASRKDFARETADKLFDGDPKTKLCVGKLALRESDPKNCLAVYFRLPDDAKPVVKYNFCSADDTDRYPERNPTSWAIWCSADGKTWRLVDERSNASSPKSMLTWWNGSRPYSFGGERPCADMADEVNPFIGAVTQHPRSALGGHGLGKTFPGATTPCGMIQLSPDTVTGGDNGCGYSYHHETIEGFSFTHLSGVGWYGDFGNFQVMPTTGARTLDRDKAKSAYSHEREVAEAGYYAVTLDRYNIRAEMTAAPRAGILRFTFPESKEARIQIDLGRRVGQLGRWLKHSRQHVRVVDDHTIEGRMECPWQDGGWGHGHGRVHYVVNFTCAFSKPFKRYGVWDKDQVFEACRDYTGTNTGFFAEFETAKDEQILVRAGLSYVDQEGARKNLARDIPDFDFDRARRAARALWSDAFAGVKVKGGSVDERIVFATCLYHALIDPRMIGDVDGRYMGSDGKVYRNERFTARTVFSGWDVFRSEMPLLTLIRPDIVNDTINSMLRWNELGPRDTLPVWDLFGCTSGCMVGNPIIPCITDAYEKGIRNWDAETAWRLADNTSRKRGNAACGWTPNSISVTLEYAYDDWCMGKFAEMLGKTDDAKRYYERAGWYRNIWSKEAGWMRSRKADGSWAPWRGREKHGQGCVESNPWQQGWFVPHDIYGLMELMGGEKKFADELEAFFDKAPANFMWGDCYNHPNEVTHLVPFMFPYGGKPWLTQKWTRRICEGAYGNEVYGYVGNEDEGQMSAWYILAASGLHPACPGSGVWILTSPMFPEISFRLPPGGRASSRAATFTIRANGVSKQNIYIRSAKLNGKPLDRAWITTKEVSAGGLLELEMGAEPAFDAFPVRPPRTN